MKRKPLKWIALLLFIAILAVASLFLAKKYHNPFPKEGSLFQIIGIDASEIDCIGIYSRSVSFEVRAFETKEELEPILHMLGQNLSFVGRYKNSSINDCCFGYDFYLFYQGKYYLTIEVGTNEVHFTYNNMTYIYKADLDFDLPTLKDLPGILPRLYWESKEDYTRVSIAEARSLKVNTQTVD